MSRRERNREITKNLIQRIYGFLVWLFIVSILAVAYYFSILTFVVLSVVVFFGILSTNRLNIRSIIPGIDSRNWLIRLSAACFYLAAVILLISKVGFYSNK